MPSSISYEPGALPVARSSDQLLVFRYFDKATSFDQKFEYLPWVKCLGISTQEGANPGTARFRYSFGDPYGDFDNPERFEQVFPLDAVGPKVINADDRLVVRRVTEEGISEYLMDAFVQAPSADLNADTETVSFVALGTPVREWDTPLPGALMRDADFPGADVNRPTDLPARFNPDGRPNASPDGSDSGTDPAQYPCFLGPVGPTNLINGDVVRTWTLAMAARYVIVRGTMQLKDDGSDDEASKYVTFEDLTYLDDLLTSWTPTGPGEADAYAALQEALTNPDATPEEIAAAEDLYDSFWDDSDTGVIDSEDDSSFVIQDLEAPDLDVTGMPWPAALERLISAYNFSFRFELSEAEPAEGEELAEGQFGDPKWTLHVYWKESDAPGKTLSLQKAGGFLDPGQTNVGELSLARDSSGIANRVAIDAAPVRIEAPLVMAPGFHVDPADADDPGQFARAAFGTDEDAESPTGDKYRLYIFDECGEGHFDFKTFTWFDNTMEGIAGDLTPALESITPARLKDAVGDAARFWSIRRRPTLTTMNSVGTDGKPMQATIYCSTDYAGDMPGVWDGTGTWQALVTGEWRALDDRLGFYLTANDVNDWSIGVDEEGAIIAQLDGGRIQNVTWTATPTLEKKYPRYMLLCTFDADNDFDVVAGKRAASTTGFTVTRRVDARDRFRKLVVNKWSFFLDFSLSNYGQEDLVLTDDEADARALADAERRHSESCTFAGTATVPRITTAFILGDKVLGIDGRDVSFRSNLGAEQLESPVYPSIVGISFNFDGGQSTVLQLSDERAQPPPRRGRRMQG